MGDEHAHQEEAEERLRREAQELLSELHVKLDELERARSGRPIEHNTPEERRRRFRLIRGGGIAVIVAACYEMLRRPMTAVASGLGATTILAMPVMLEEPQPAPPADLPAVVVQQPKSESNVLVEPVDNGQARTDTGQVIEEFELDPPEPTPTARSTEPMQVFEPRPSRTPTPTAEPTSQALPPSPSPIPTLIQQSEPTPEVTPLDAEAEACLEVDLEPTTSVSTCLDLDVGL